MVGHSGCVDVVGKPHLETIRFQGLYPVRRRPGLTKWYAHIPEHLRGALPGHSGIFAHHDHVFRLKPNPSNAAVVCAVPRIGADHQRAGLRLERDPIVGSTTPIDVRVAADGEAVGVEGLNAVGQENFSSPQGLGYITDHSGDATDAHLAGITLEYDDIRLEAQSCDGPIVCPVTSIGA